MSPPLTIAQRVARIARGEQTPTDLLELCLDQIRRHEREIRAWVKVDEAEAREQARAIENGLASGRPPGPLCGMPIGIKDIVDVKGWPTLAGSSLRAGHVAEGDATLVKRLRAAGAVILGKTVTTQFASFDPPPTRNPWNTSRTPGGSSSGSAAAVACGMCVAAIGSQTGGSIIRPASYCGVAGFKPAFGRISLCGVLPLAYHLDHPGPIARCVSDLATVTEVIGGPDSADPRTLGPWEMNVRGPAPRIPPVFGLATDLVRQTNRLVQEAVGQAIEQLQAAGARIEERQGPHDLEEILVWHRRIMAVEAAEYHRSWYPARHKDYAPCISQLLDEGLAMTAVDYAEAMRRMTAFRRAVPAQLEGLTGLLLPATTTTAPGTDTTGDPRFNSPWSFSGLPNVSVPCAMATDGMPVAMQIVGPPLGESELLASASWCEEVWSFFPDPRT
jgi:aspartyl-tRNA(Asn)/glutamyl-tRNA(Gln) amidotransferase subunit A